MFSFILIFPKTFYYEGCIANALQNRHPKSTLPKDKTKKNTTP